MTKQQKVTLERVIGNPIAKRMYVALIPIDNLLGDMQEEMDDGVRDADDPHFGRIVKIRGEMLKIMEEVMA